MKISSLGKNTWINYQHLYYFSVIAGEGSITTASKRLGIGQSALSIQLKVFEENLGMKLFDRSHRKLELTENGRHILSYAKEIFRLGGEMIEVLNDRPSSGRTHLQVGALDSIPKHLTLQLAKTALAGGKCSISIVEGKSEMLFTDLADHRIDLLLTNLLPTGASGKYYHKRIARLPLYVAGSRSHLNLRKEFPKSLRGKKFILPTVDSSVRRDIDSFFKQNGVEPDIIAEAQDVMIQKLLALEGLGLTVVPEIAIREYLTNRKLFLIGKITEFQEELFLVSATRRIENPIAARLMKNFQVK